MKKLSTWDIIGLTVILVLIAFTLVPAVARIQRTASETTCQGNMNALANAIAQYCADNNGVYPTNRYINASSISVDVMLSKPGLTHLDGTPKRFMYGINWVEALYPYIWAKEAKISRSYQSVYICPNAANKTYPAGSTTAAVTYAFNINLVEHCSQLISDPNKLMMMREMDRLFNSVLRPSNDSGGLSTNNPINPFLDSADEAISTISARTTAPNQHSNGSYILFADGHVGFFTTDYMPNQTQIFSAKCWDAETQQWWNFNSTNPYVPEYMRRTIAITP